MEAFSCNFVGNYKTASAAGKHLYNYFALDDDQMSFRAHTTATPWKPLLNQFITAPKRNRRCQWETTLVAFIVFSVTYWDPFNDVMEHGQGCELSTSF